jgi:hypothetical protein
MAESLRLSGVLVFDEILQDCSLNHCNDVQKNDVEYVTQSRGHTSAFTCPQTKAVCCVKSKTSNTTHPAPFAPIKLAIANGVAITIVETATRPVAVGYCASSLATDIFEYKEALNKIGTVVCIFVGTIGEMNVGTNVGTFMFLVGSIVGRRLFVMVGLDVDDSVGDMNVMVVGISVLIVGDNVGYNVG